MQAREAVMPASELAAARADIAKLQRVLGEKTLENEILNEAVERRRCPCARPNRRRVLDCSMVRVLASPQQSDRPSVRFVDAARHATGLQLTLSQGTDRPKSRSRLFRRHDDVCCHTRTIQSQESL